MEKDLNDKVSQSSLSTLDSSDRKRNVDSNSFLFFEIKGGKYALSLKNLKEVISFRPICQVPFKKQSPFHGIVNVQGQILCCFFLHSILPTSHNKPCQESCFSRMLIMQSLDMEWVFPVNHIYSIEKVAVENYWSPIKDTALKDFTVLKGMRLEKGETVFLVDEDVMIKLFNRSRI